MEMMTRRLNDGHACMDCQKCEYKEKGCFEIICLNRVKARLAAYEDTGLEPEEIAGLCEMDKRSRMAQMLRWEQADSQGRLEVLNTEQEDEYTGLKRKYIVHKADTGEPVENCFVLRPDKDPAAIAALTAYAKSTSNKVLADDILQWIKPDEKVDVVSVMRCGKCKHHRNIPGTNSMMCNKIPHVVMRAGAYCSYGECKDAEGGNT